MQQTTGRNFRGSLFFEGFLTSADLYHIAQAANLRNDLVKLKIARNSDLQKYVVGAGTGVVSHIERAHRSPELIDDVHDLVHHRGFVRRAHPEGYLEIRR